MTNFILVILSELLRVVKPKPFLLVADNLYLIQSLIAVAKVKFFKEVREYCELLSIFLKESKGQAAATKAVSPAAAAAAVDMLKFTGVSISCDGWPLSGDEWLCFAIKSSNISIVKDGKMKFPLPVMAVTFFADSDINNKENINFGSSW